MAGKSTGFFAEFKKFISRGNVIDLAVGVIIGGAFSSITTSLVNDVVMPFVGLFLGGIDFSSWAISVGPIFAGQEPAVILIGSFIKAIVNFLILAFVVFTFVRTINRMRDRAKKEEPAAPPAPPAPSAEEVLLTEIRDLLASQNHIDGK